MKISIFLQNDAVKEFSFSDEHLDYLKSLFLKNNFNIDVINCKTEKDFIAELQSSNIVIVWSFKQEWFSIAKDLKIIWTPAAGVDYFDNITLPKNIILKNSSFHGQIMAETIIGAMLAETRGLFISEELKTSEVWWRDKISGNVRLLKGANVVILGFGNIGKAVGKVATMFNANVYGIDSKNISKLNDYLKIADHLVITLPATKSTDNIINTNNISLLKESAVIYNFGRGNAIESEALINALKSKKIKGAYLDVFKNEPLSINCPYRKIKNAHIYPHSSAISKEYLFMFCDEFVDKLINSSSL